LELASGKVEAGFVDRERCVEDMTRRQKSALSTESREIDCIMAAKSLGALDLCARKKAESAE